MDHDKIEQFKKTAIGQGYSKDDVQKFVVQRLALSLIKQKLAEKTGQIGGQVGGALQGAYQIPEQIGKGILSAFGPITQAFGNYNPAIEKYSGGVNYGVDIGVPMRTKVSLPSGEWKVIESSNKGDFNRGYGNSLLVQNTKTGEKLRFSHLDQLANLTKDQVLQGGINFGLTGATGNVTGPHLDLEYYNQMGKAADVLRTIYGKELFGG